MVSTYGTRVGQCLKPKGACPVWKIFCGVVGVAAWTLLAIGCSNSTSPDSLDRSEETAFDFFTPITESAGLDAFRHHHGGFGDKWFPEIMGSGGGFIDYDADGWLDIVLVGGGSLPGRPQEDVPALSLYRNNGDGTFTDVTAEAGLSDLRAYGMGVVVADYDNDGDQDFLLTTLQGSRLFRNEEGVFQDVSREAGLADNDRWGTSALFFDADRDGHLDIYVANYVEWTPETVVRCMNEGVRDYCNPRRYRGVADVYYRNNGDGTFTNAATEAGFLDGIVSEQAKGLGVIDLDFNSDGWPDVYVTNDGEPNFLFVNDGDGTFTETALRSGVAFDHRGTPRAGMGVDAGVVDSTGETTLFVGNFSNETVSVWRHQRDGLFIDRATASGLGYPTMKTLTFGLVLFDGDLDTDLDLLLANGNVVEQIASLQEGVTFEQPPQLFLNRGDGTFEEVTQAGRPLADSMLARGLAVGDIDRDGDPDVLMTENNGPVHLWRNDFADGRFLRVRLQGTESNRDGVGARVRATVNGLTMERRVRAGGSYLSQSEKIVTFGLGDRRVVSMLEVVWPSGRVEQFEDVASNQEVLLVEGAGELVAVPTASAVASRAGS